MSIAAIGNIQSEGGLRHTGSPRNVWFFLDSQGEIHATSYTLSSVIDATALAESEYGFSVTEARQRLLTWDQYCAMLACNINGGQGPRIYSAMKRILFDGVVTFAG